MKIRAMLLPLSTARHKVAQDRFSGVGPLRDPASPPSHSIQPSFKPSIICARGSGSSKRHWTIEEVFVPYLLEH
jgi:hypothetical protein